MTDHLWVKVGKWNEHIPESARIALADQLAMAHHRRHRRSAGRNTVVPWRPSRSGAGLCLWRGSRRDGSQGDDRPMAAFHPVNRQLPPIRRPIGGPMRPSFRFHGFWIPFGTHGGAQGQN